MDKKKLMLLLGALVVAIGTALAAKSMLTGASAPKEMVQDAYFIDGEADMNKLLGTVVRYPVTAGQPVTQGALVAPGDRGFLAAALGPGMRAITISASGKQGVAGFIFPGDHVDLMLTQTVKATDGGDAMKAAETIMRNVRVLATDQSTESETSEGKTIVRKFGTVTLEVTPKIAEKIAVAQTLGTISLSLRSIADNQAELDQAIASGSVKVPAGATKDQEEKFLNQAMNRPMEGGTTFVTGGDVSRFQRKSMPSQQSVVNQAARTVANTIADRAGMPAAGGAGSAPVIRLGPVVRVTRGKSTTEEPVGGR